MNCGFEINFKNFEEKNIILLDFSWKKQEYELVKKVAKKVMILDHYDLAIKELENVEGCFFNMNESGASLAWEYFFPGNKLFTFILYVKDRNLWWRGIIIIVVALVLFVIMFRLQKYTKGYDILKMYFWSFSHILLYFVLTHLRDIGRFGWHQELTECHTLCWSKFGIPARCPGYHDIATNFIGISSAVWIKYHINTGY